MYNDIRIIDETQLFSTGKRRNRTDRFTREEIDAVLAPAYRANPKPLPDEYERLTNIINQQFGKRYPTEKIRVYFANRRAQAKSLPSPDMDTALQLVALKEAEASSSSSANAAATNTQIVVVASAAAETSFFRRNVRGPNQPPAAIIESEEEAEARREAQRRG